jgi:hypothetical protein
MMQKKRYSKQVKSLALLMRKARTIPQAHMTEEQAEALSRAILADDALVPREILVGVAYTYQKLVESGKIKKEATFEELIKYQKH